MSGYICEVRMARIGVRELKNRATEVIRAVREQGTEYVVTLRGRPVALLLPLDEARLEAEDRQLAEAAVMGDELQAELEALRREIGASWRSEQTGVELVEDGRRI